VKVEYGGTVYDFDLLKMPTEELREIKRKLGLTVAAFLRGVTEVDVDAMMALKWAVLRSDGQHDDLVLNADDPFADYWDFVQAWNAKEDEEAEPDPTLAGSLPATSTPPSTGSSNLTSTTSSTSTGIPWPGSSESANGTSDGSPTPASSVT